MKWRLTEQKRRMTMNAMEAESRVLEARRLTWWTEYNSRQMDQDAAGGRTVSVCSYNVCQ